MFLRFTDRARKVFSLANEEAKRRNHEHIGTEHVLLGLLNEGSGVGAYVLKSLQIDFDAVRHQVGLLAPQGPATSYACYNCKLPQTPSCLKMVEYAIEESLNLNHDYVGTEHLLLGLLRDHDGGAAQALTSTGLTLEQVRQEVRNVLGAGTEPNTAEKADGASTPGIVGRALARLVAWIRPA